jgi:hypothetical protein
MVSSGDVTVRQSATTITPDGSVVGFKGRIAD